MEGTRRELIAGMALATALPAAAEAARRTGAKPTAPAIFPPKPGPVTPLAPDGRLTVNRERATRLMKAAGVEAIIAGTDANSRYITNLRSILSDFGLAQRIIGILPADPSKPVVAVLPTSDIGRATAPDREWPMLVTWSAPAEPDRYKGIETIPGAATVASTGRSPWPRGTDGALTPREASWEQNETTLPIADAASAELGVKKALESLGLTRAKVAVDDDALAQRLARSGLDRLTVVPGGENLLLKIRLVKSPVEIERMRTVSRLNDASARAMIGQLRPGMAFEDIQSIFFSELAKRGGRPEFIVAGMVSGLRQGRLIEGEPFLVDCCGNFNGYSGDWARTVVLGTPPSLLIKRATILGRIADEIAPILKPGTRYSEISAKGAAIAKKLGADWRIGVGPHSVGLGHSEDPLRDDVPFPARNDTVLEEGMVITVDLPTLDPGWGSMHLESLILITRDGGEWLDRHDDPLYEVMV